MNEYRCETCKDILCKCNPKQDGIQFSPNWIFTRKYGCASHSDFQSEQYCIWTEDEDGVYQTSCLHSFEFMNGTPESNGIKFCPYCGKELRQAGEPSIHIGFQNTTDIQASGGGGGCCNHEEYIKSIQQQRGEP